MGNSKKRFSSKVMVCIMCCTLAVLIAAGFLLNTEAQNSLKENDTTIPESFMITEDNYFDYQSGLECSAFASAYVLRHYGEEADGVTLFETFPGKVWDGGVSPYGIETFFNERGYNIEYKCNGTINDLKEQVSKGVPVIVFIRVNEQEIYTHYVPLVGYDEDYFYFAESLPYMANCKEEEGLSYNRKTAISTFERLWNDIDGMWNYPYFIISSETVEVKP